MKKGKNIYYYPGCIRPYVFEKYAGGKRISRRFSTLQKARDYAERIFRELNEKGTKALLMGEADRKLLADLREICGAETDLRRGARREKA